MPLCCQTISIGLGIFCHCQAFSVELEKSFSGPLCALPLCNSPHEWKCPKFTCDFAYSVAWKPRPFFRPAWQYLCLGWCQIFSPLKLCAVSSSTDLCIKKVTTRVGFCLVAASLDPPLGWKFLWIYMGEYPSRCMPPPPQGRHMAWHDLVLKPSTVYYHDELSHPVELAAMMLIENVGNQPTFAWCQQPKTTLVNQNHLTILATDYQQWDYPWWTLELWFLPRSSGMTEIAN